MKLILHSLLLLPQILALAIPTPGLYPIDTDDLEILTPPGAYGLHPRQLVMAFPEIAVYKGIDAIIHLIHPDTAVGTLVDGPKGESDHDVGDPASYEKLRARDPSIDDWVHALSQTEVVRKERTMNGGREQIEAILKAHMEYLPQGWQDMKIPNPLPPGVGKSNRKAKKSSRLMGKDIGADTETEPDSSECKEGCSGQMIRPLDECFQACSSFVTVGDASPSKG